MSINGVNPYKMPKGGNIKIGIDNSSLNISNFTVNKKDQSLTSTFAYEEINYNDINLNVEDYTKIDEKKITVEENMKRDFSFAKIFDSTLLDQDTIYLKDLKESSILNDKNDKVEENKVKKEASAAKNVKNLTSETSEIVKNKQEKNTKKQKEEEKVKEKKYKNIINDGSEKWTSSSGEEFSLFKQNGDIYGKALYPARGRGETVGARGCGPTCISIIESAYGGTATPANLVANGEYYSSYDTILGYFKNNKTYEKVEFQKNMTDDEITKKINDGYKIICLTKGGKIGSYYIGNYNHWYTMLDYKEGKVYVGDPLTKGGGWFNLSDLTKRDNYILVKKGNGVYSSE